MVSPGIQALIALIALVIISTIFVGLRLYLRWCQHGVLGASDIVVCLTLMSFITYVVIDSQMLLDAEIWTANPTFADFALMYFTLGREKLEWILQVIFLITFPYYTSLWGVKLSLLLFYYSITPPSRAFQKFRWMFHGATILTVASWLGFLFISLFWCFPISRNWDILNKNGGLCISYGNRHFPYKYTVAFHIITDIIIFCIPFPIIKALKLPRRKFIAVSSVFLLGILNLIVTVIRVVAIANLYPVSAITVITGLEQALGIIVVCCPAFKGLVGRWISSWRCQRSGETTLDFRDIGSDHSKLSLGASHNNFSSTRSTVMEPIITASAAPAVNNTLSTLSMQQTEKRVDIPMDTFFTQTIVYDLDQESDGHSYARSLEEIPEVVSPLGSSRERADSDTIAEFGHLGMFGGSFSTTSSPIRAPSFPATLARSSTSSHYKPASPLAINVSLSQFPPDHDPMVSPKSAVSPSRNSPMQSAGSQSSSPLVTPTRLASFPMPSPHRARLSSVPVSVPTRVDRFHSLPAPISTRERMASLPLPSPTSLPGRDRRPSFPATNSNRGSGSSGGRRYSSLSGSRRGSVSHVLV